MTMRHKKQISVGLFAVSMILVLSGCQATSLLSANGQFVDLMTREAELQALYEAGRITELNYSSASESLEEEFYQSGSKAQTAAGSAKNTRTKASFLNVAARNYLKAGQKGEEQILAVAEKGKSTCEGLSQADYLPATCAYFAIVVPQAVNNTEARRVQQFRGKLASQLGLTDDEWVQMQSSFASLNTQTRTLNDLDAASIARYPDPRLNSYILRQQTILYCNALITFSDFRKYALESGAGWTKAQVVSSMRNALGQRGAELRQRGGGKPPACKGELIRSIS